jgi:hypothetical protein
MRSGLSRTVLLIAVMAAAATSIGWSPGTTRHLAWSAVDFMPPDLARIFMPLHDELSKRTSGELPADFDSDIKPEWAKPLAFDRDKGYDPSWIRYDQVDIYGDPLE